MLVKRLCRVTLGRNLELEGSAEEEIEASGRSGKSARWLVADDEDIAPSKVVQGFTAMTHLLQTGSCAP